jgi:hypothetical protein
MEMEIWEEDGHRIWAADEGGYGEGGLGLKVWNHSI